MKSQLPFHRVAWGICGLNCQGSTDELEKLLSSCSDPGIESSILDRCVGILKWIHRDLEIRLPHVEEEVLDPILVLVLVQENHLYVCGSAEHE